MNDEFDKMVVNLNRIVDSLCTELNIVTTMEDLYSHQFMYRPNVACDLDDAVRMLLEAVAPGLHYTLQAKKLSAATEVLRGVLIQLRDEQSTNAASPRVSSKKNAMMVGRRNASSDGLTALGDDVADHGRSRVSRRGETVFVQIDHLSETNFFTDLSSEISRGGLFVATYDVLRAGTPLKLLLSLPCGRSFPVRGSVSWVREIENCAEGASPGMGITFERLSSDLTAAVNRYMARRPPLLFEMA